MAELLSHQETRFGPFRLLSGQRLLLEGNRPVQIGSRALDILIALVERAGEVIDKQELIRSVWRNVTVEEANLRVHVAALRRALKDGEAGARYIVNSSGRGYSFVAKIEQSEIFPSTQELVPKQTPPPQSLPRLLTRIVGRDAALLTITGQLTRHRLLTLVGPGGIGKTTVALAVAERLLETYDNGVCFVDLAPIVDPDLAASTVASALGLPTVSIDVVPNLNAHLADQRMLIVLDTCEHVIEASARLVEEILKGCSNINILATSREPLRAEGEFVHRLPPLDTPKSGGAVTAATATAFSAVRLFAERAASSFVGFTINDANAAAVGDICARLDGIPLAIEMAAAYIGVFGVQGLADQLSDAFLRAQGRRTAFPRHQTLNATLDWSYALLSEPERKALRWLSVLSGSFTLRTAIAIAEEDEARAGGVIAGLTSLVAKSMISADITRSVAQYRLLDTTRAYASTKLEEAGEREAAARRHAGYLCRLLERAEAESRTRPTLEWLADYGGQLDNLRAALDWAFSPGGDVRLGVALTIASAPLWMYLSLVDECRRNIERALAVLAQREDFEAKQEMKLWAALGSAVVQPLGVPRDIGSIWERSLTIAEELGDREYQLRALWGLWIDQYYKGNLEAALAIAHRYQHLAELSSDPIDRLSGRRMLGTILHCLGSLTEAQQHLEDTLSQHGRPAHRGHIIRYQHDLSVGARSTLALVQWVRGFPDQATRLIETNVEEASASGHVLSICQALITAGPLSLMTGNLAAAERYVAMLLDYTLKYGGTRWNAWGRCVHGVLLIRRGERSGGLARLRDGLDEISRTGFKLRTSSFRNEVIEWLGRAGQVETALAAIDEALERAEHDGERWCFAEMLRVKGELKLMAAAPPEVAEALFTDAVDWAQKIGALSWELRAATSLARLRLKTGHAALARSTLVDVFGKFGEGFATSDLVTAKALIDQCRGGARFQTD